MNNKNQSIGNKRGTNNYELGGGYNILKNILHLHITSSPQTVELNYEIPCQSMTLSQVVVHNNGTGHHKKIGVRISDIFGPGQIMNNLGGITLIPICSGYNEHEVITFPNFTISTQRKIPRKFKVEIMEYDSTMFTDFEHIDLIFEFEQITG